MLIVAQRSILKLPLVPEILKELEGNEMDDDALIEGTSIYTGLLIPRIVFVAQKLKFERNKIELAFKR